jgi:energy-coupling factor transporter ATP-binding protein EcfA2
MSTKSESVIVIAGPSGAGKTTFLELLRRKMVPKTIAALLPEDVDEWSVFEANNIASDFFIHGEKQIVHYDTVDIRRYPQVRYNNDPRLSFLKECKNVLMITLQPKGEQLLEQFSQRQSMRNKNKPAFKVMWAKGRRKLKRLIAYNTSRYAKLDRDELYKSSEAVDYFQEQWNSFLSELEHLPDTKLRSIIICPNGYSEKGIASFVVLS